MSKKSKLNDKSPFNETSGFYNLLPKDRLSLIKKLTSLTDDQYNLLREKSNLDLKIADNMVENVIGTFPIPLGIACNFHINSKDYFIPMAVEESSVIAAASNAAKMARKLGGFKTSNTGSIMIGQIQIIELLDPNKAKSEILKNKKKLLKYANDQDPILLSLGGGAQDIEVNVIKTNSEIILVVHLIVNCLDAMGANAINTMSESIAPLLEKISNGKVLLRIISNLAVKRLVRSNAIFDKDSVGGEKIVDLIIKAYEFADSDPYRCATHNKGIMNGITSVALATGQDTRAIEAGAHSYASFHGQYKSLTKWEKNTDGNLVGTIELPLAVGLIGGATAVHPIAKACLNILGINNVTDLSAILASVGLAQNLGALRALVSEGIQKGHMKLHARNLAVSAGATGELIDKVANHMIKNSSVRFDIAKSLISKLKK